MTFWKGLLLCCCWIISSSLWAQNIAYINAGEVLEAMSEYKEAELTLKKLEGTLAFDLKQQQDEIQAFYDLIVAEGKAGNLTDKQKADAKVRLDEMQNELQLSSQEAQQKLNKKEAELTEGIQTKFKTAIAKVAKTGGYNYILDERYLLNASEDLDVTDAVRKELGIKP